METNLVRSTFIDYFVKNGHKHVQASPLIPHNDPSLMFVNSGMVQFKNVFTGLEKRDYVRATTAQKCVRAGGKHNDLDNVGYTARHHTFFEMLGNFSFGDYFKEQAIYYAWNLITKEFGIDKTRLYATIYHNDDEAFSYWKKISGFEDSRIIRIDTNDNFWSMGNTGPCGPCSEIFYDHGDKVFGGLPGTKDADGDRYVEIWNMVFMQFEQINKNTRIPLAQQSIDTGMGLERISAVLQGKLDNYNTDTFQSLIEHAESLTKVKSEGEYIPFYKVITDHLRSSCFLIADGVMPSNEGRGYVLRRIMRRAMRYIHQLGHKDALMHKLVKPLVHVMDFYPELARAEDLITSILLNEEEKFKSLLDRGLKMLDTELCSLTKPVLSGEVAFKLYDTYGFPLDLTQDILRTKKISVDQEEFNSCMQKQREKAREAWTGSGESKNHQIWFDLKEKFGTTEFLGYSLDSSEAKVLAIIHSNQTIASASQGQEVIIITNQTPFYGESGGQKGDVGFITKDSFKAKVVDTKKYLGIIAHNCVIESESIKSDENVLMTIDVEYRNNLRKHHSATHILQATLQQVLGKHVIQQGSLVSSDKLRFDFTHPKQVSPEEILLIETKVNEVIMQNTHVHTEIMNTEDAMSKGAMALFGEKYDSEVRVVSMGHKSNKELSEHENSLIHYSLELCGGTHVSRTGDIGLFKILSESSIASGVRRIEAVCGSAALAYVNDAEKLIKNISSVLKVSQNEIIQKIETIQNNNKDLEKELLNIQVQSLSPTQHDIDSAIKFGSALLIFKNSTIQDAKVIRAAVDNAIQAHKNAVVLYTYKADSTKISGIIGIGHDLKDLDAGAISKKLTSIIEGSGGGNKSIAQFSGLAHKFSQELFKGLL